MNFSGSDIPHITNALPLITALDDGASADSFWTSADLHELWAQQMQTSIAEDLRSMDPMSAIVSHRLGSEVSPPIVTYGELLVHPHPPIDLLRMVKEFAKREAMMPEGALPQPIVRSIYHSVILLARVRCGVSISGLPDDKLTDAIRWILDQRWMDGSTAGFLAKAIASINSASVEGKAQ